MEVFCTSWIEESVRVKLSREYFLLWVINTSSMEILTLQHFRFVQTKQRLTNLYITNET